MAWILAFWSILFEWIGPRFITHAVGDWLDVVMYWIGAVVAWIFWQFESAARNRPSANEL